MSQMRSSYILAVCDTALSKLYRCSILWEPSKLRRKELATVHCWRAQRRASRWRGQREARAPPHTHRTVYYFSV